MSCLRIGMSLTYSLAYLYTVHYYVNLDFSSTRVHGYKTLETLPNPYPSRRVPLPAVGGKGFGGYGYGYKKKTRGLPGPYTRCK